MPSSPPSGSRLPWHQRRGPSAWVLIGLLLVVVLVTASLATGVADVLPELGRDVQGDEPWDDPLAVEKAESFRIVHVPDCAQAPIHKIVLWDEDSKPYWTVEGPPASLAAFVIGAAPPGFEVVVPFEAPPPGAVLRVGVFRTTGSAAGTRYRESDLRTGYAVSGDPVKRYRVENFTKGAVCGEDEGDEDGSGAGLTSTTVSTPTSDPVGDDGGTDEEIPDDLFGGNDSINQFFEGDAVDEENPGGTNPEGVTPDDEVPGNESIDGVLPDDGVPAAGGLGPAQGVTPPGP